MQTEVILDLLLQEAKKSNGTMEIIKEKLLRDMGAGGGGGGPGPNPPPNPPPGGGSSDTISKLFENVFKGAASAFGNMLSSTANTSTLVSSLGSAAGSLGDAFGSIPGPVGAAGQAFMKIVQVGAKVYEWMDGQLKMYQDLNSAGVQLTDGIFGFRKSAGDALLSMDDFSKVMKGNTDSLSAMNDQYGDGVKYFGGLVNSITMAQKQIGIYGLSQQQIANVAAKNFKLDKLYGANKQMSDLQQQQSSQQYISTLSSLSKVLGTSVDDLLKKNESFSQSYEGFSFDTVLDRLLPPDSAAKVSKEFGAFTAATGEAGENLQHIMSQFLATGKLPADIGQWGHTLIPFFDNMKSMIESGTFDPKVATEALKKLSTDSSTAEGLANDIQAAMATGNSAGASMLTTFRNASVLLNTTSGTTKSSFETLQTMMDNYLANSIMKPMQQLIGDTGLAMSKYLSETYERTGSLWATAEQVFLDGLGKLIDVGAYLPKKLVALFVGEDMAGSLFTGMKQIFLNILGSFQMIGKAVWDFFFGTKDEFTKDLSLVKESIFGVINNVKDLFQKVKDFLSNMSFDGIKENVKDGVKNLGNKIKNTFGDKWNALTGAVSGKETTPAPAAAPSTLPSPGTTTPSHANSDPGVKPPKQTVNAKPEVTRPEKVEAPDTTAKNTNQDPKTIPPTQAETDIVSLLNRMVNGTSEQITALNNAVKALNNISTNTEPVRNA